MILTGEIFNKKLKALTDPEQKLVKKLLDFQTLESQKLERNINTNPTNSMNKNIKNLTLNNEGAERFVAVNVSKFYRILLNFQSLCYYLSELNTS